MKSYKSYLCDEENFMLKLNKYGVCVIPNIIEEDKCIEYRNNLWSELKYIQQNRFDINDEKTWKNFYDFMPLHSMLIQHHGIAHLQTVWNIRQNEKVGEIFSKIWKVPKEELLSSFDGISVNLPPEKTNKGWYLGNNWMHTDQGPRKKGFHCIQGLINLYPVNPGDATLTILQKSHKLHEDFYSHLNYDSSEDWYKLNEQEKKWYIDKGCKQYCIKAPIGSLVLWDSRTIHQGIEAQKDRENQNFRMVIYTCLLPKNKFSKKDREKRVKAFNDFRVTNHWGNKLFPKTPRTYGRELKEFNLPNVPQLTNYGKLLI